MVESSMAIDVSRETIKFRHPLPSPNPILLIKDFNPVFQTSRGKTSVRQFSSDTGEQIIEYGKNPAVIKRNKTLGGKSAMVSGTHPIAGPILIVLVIDTPIKCLPLPGVLLV